MRCSRIKMQGRHNPKIKQQYGNCGAFNPISHRSPNDWHETQVEQFMSCQHSPKHDPKYCNDCHCLGNTLHHIEYFYLADIRSGGQCCSGSHVFLNPGKHKYEKERSKPQQSNHVACIPSECGAPV